jgi:hypothetical protein
MRNASGETMSEPQVTFSPSMRRAVVALATLIALSVLGCSGGADARVDDRPHAGSDSVPDRAPSNAMASRVEPEVRGSSQALVPTANAEYKFDAAVDPDILDDRKTQVWARVYYPWPLDPNQRYPLLVFLHGNHNTCGHGSNPRVDDKNDYMKYGTCPDDYKVVPNHDGYGYLAESLAANQFIVVSINANRGIGAAHGITGDQDLILARARLILKHLTLLSQWDCGTDCGADPTPPSLHIDLYHQLDFTRVGLLGHSRGGEAVRAAYFLYTQSGSPWRARIVSPVRFAGLFEIAPTDGLTPFVLNALNTRRAVILPMCDGDVADLEGVEPFDRMQAATTESVPAFKSTLTVWGANHNFFNTEWQTPDAADPCIGHDALFMPASETGGSQAQRSVALASVSAFFLGMRDPSMNRLFDPRYQLPASVTSITRVDRGYLETPDSSATLHLEDFVNATGTSTFGQPNDASHMVATHQWDLPEHSMSMRGAVLAWGPLNGVPGASRYFQSNFAAVGSSISLMGYDSLDLRVERAVDDALNASPSTDFSVALVNAANTPSSSVAISGFVSLTGPVGGPGGLHMMLQTARIPLDSFGMPLDAIRGVRLTFDRTDSGAIYVANIRATKSGRGSGFLPPVSQAEPEIAAPPEEAPLLANATRQARDWARASRIPTRFAQGRIVSVGDDIEVASDTPFPVIDDVFVLRAGAVAVTRSDFPDPGDLRRLIFTLTPEERRLLRPGDEVTVMGGGTQWKLGRLDDSLLR